MIEKPKTISASDRLRILVLGYLVRGPIGGLAWHHLQYVAGFKRLGHKVCFLEDSGDYPACYNPTTYVTSTDPEYGLTFAQHALTRLGIGEDWAYYDAHTRTWRGPLGELAIEECRCADVLVNLSGINPLRPWLREVPIRILVDTDPAFSQIRHLNDLEARREASRHNAYFTFGENINQANCSIPIDTFDWVGTRQPVVLSAWPVVPAPPSAPFSTIMQWDSYAEEEHNGVRYGMKSKSFQPFMELPSRVSVPLEIALGSESAPRADLARKGWRLTDPSIVSRDPWTYQTYLQQSRAEFSIAKAGYVISNSGWFSERSANYLASGRPTVVQETGFSDWLHREGGVVSFESFVEAQDAIEEVNAHYEFHCSKAREVAKEYFDSDKVLTQLLSRVSKVV